MERMESLREAAERVVAAHTAVIEGVTPQHPNWCATDNDEYSARFSAWHGACYSLAALLATNEAQDG